MKLRTVQKQTHIETIPVGPFTVKQPLPAPGLDQVSPFILLHHAGPATHAPGALQARLSPHPHRGFEPVTFLFLGGLHHRDSLGSEGFLQGGDVQWMTAGSGIIHSEGPSAQFAAEGGIMELIQLWVNLPRGNKMTKPKYQDIKADSIPHLELNGFSFRVVAGELAGATGPASTFTPMLAATATFTEGATVELPFDPDWNVLVYVLDGSLQAGAETLAGSNLGVFRTDGEGISLAALSGGRLLLLAGQPISEPMVSYGPFVMNYEGELRKAVLDFHEGRMGVLEA
ncbi:MAG: pirin family protein [Flaviaesturariibacter sp.]|nr:pirin family protein [Flaviaesturariibacter sp.]